MLLTYFNAAKNTIYFPLEQSHVCVLTLPLGDHLEAPPPAAAVPDANWCPSVADADDVAPPGPAIADAAALALATTAVEVLLPVAVPAVVLPTLEALLPLLPALLPPTVWLKFIDEQPTLRGRRVHVLDWRVPSLKIFTIKRKLHWLIGLDWIGTVRFGLDRFGLVWRRSYCCCVDEIDYDCGSPKNNGAGCADSILPLRLRVTWK